MSDDRGALAEISALTRTFAEAELRPHVERWDQDGSLPDDTMAKLAELGFFGMLAGEAHGGMALDTPTWLAALEQLAWGDASVALAVALHGRVVRLLELQGSEAAQQLWLPALAAGEVIGCGAADDVATADCRAVQAAGGWRLSGSVHWVGNARARGLVLVGAAADPGSSLFLVPLEAPGVVRAAPAATLGLRPLGLRTLVLQDVQVAADAVLGASGESAVLPASVAVETTLAVAAVAVGIASAALDHARDYADEREQFGCKLRQFEGIRIKLADMATRTAAAAALLGRAAVEVDSAYPAMAKVCAAESAMYVTTQAVQVFGGYGYMRDYPVERLMRDARAMSLLGGADEGQRATIADRLYRE